jgi:hypothetical protein
VNKKDFYLEKLTIETLSMDRELGLVFGYAFICNINGEPHFNSKGGHFPELEMLKASVKLMESDYRPVYLEHEYGKEPSGKILFALPMTKEIGASFNLPTDKTGLIVGIKLNNIEAFSDVKLNNLPGFSVGFMTRIVKHD